MAISPEKLEEQALDTLITVTKVATHGTRLDAAREILRYLEQKRTDELYSEQFKAGVGGWVPQGA